METNNPETGDLPTISGAFIPRVLIHPPFNQINFFFFSWDNPSVPIVCSYIRYNINLTILKYRNHIYDMFLQLLITSDVKKNWLLDLFKNTFLHFFFFLLVKTFWNEWSSVREFVLTAETPGPCCAEEIWSDQSAIIGSNLENGLKILKSCNWFGFGLVC